MLSLNPTELDTVGDMRVSLWPDCLIERMCNLETRQGYHLDINARVKPAGHKKSFTPSILMLR